jgi:Gpi18-like mannosyltransferase
MIAKYQNLILLACVSIFTTIILWLPFFLHLEKVWGIPLPRDGMATVVSNYDGPYYIVAAKTLYDPEALANNTAFSLPPIYYTAHYPLYPLLIRGTATIMPFLGYPYAMMIVTLISGTLAVCMFYLLLQQLGFKKEAMWLALIFTVFPARWLIVRSVGSPEPLFLLMIMASVYFFNKEKWWYAGLFGALAQATKPPGILLFIAFVVALVAPSWPQLANTNMVAWVKKLKWQAYPILLIPLMLLGIYIFYGIRYGDFLAYFNSGDNIHLQFPPFQVFNPAQAWVGSFWLEEIVWLYVFGGLGVLYLMKQKRPTLASFVGIFFATILFVAHRDIARYMLPIVPFLFVAYAKLLNSREFKLVFALILIPIYLFAISFMSGNISPISDWGPLL